MMYTFTGVPKGMAGEFPSPGVGTVVAERECAYCGRALKVGGPGVLCVECNVLHDLCDACVEQAANAAEYGELEVAA